MPESLSETCSHISDLGEPTPQSEGCADCAAHGDKWVHLRLCLTCGYVGCCDESKNRHATRHFQHTEHPVMRSFEPGESWMWCYVDEALIYPAGSDGQEVRFAVTKEFLRRIPIFAQLADEHLSKLCEIAEPLGISAGEVLMQEGSPADALYVLVDGEFEVTKRAGREEVVVGKRGPGEVLGEMALFEQGVRSASVRALRDGRVLVISREAFYNLLAANPSAVLAILRTFISRLRSTEAIAVQHDKLASLGTLAAGLAHELNNPAAAVRRSADQLRDALSRWQRAAIDLSRLALDGEETSRLSDLEIEMEARAATSYALDTLTRSDREGELQDWLDERGVEDAWEIAPVLVGYGWDARSLEAELEAFREEHLAVVVSWLSSGTATFGLLNEVHNSAQRISEIVKAVKTYSYLDQAPVQKVDIHDGLENTLVMLRHNLKSGVQVEREYDPALPQIEGYGSELNQVWTNIIDNAVSAMGGKGKLSIRTYAQGQNVVVEIADDGPGIPPELQTRIFEPFFTTKGPGVGTGLGLHIVRNIVVEKHHGSINLKSEPGSTRFQITLPVLLAREG